MKGYPIVTLIGPRQSGKTTLVRLTFPEMPYASLEDPDTRQRAMEDPRGFLASFPSGAILDEIQRTPTLLSYIQTFVDEKKATAYSSLLAATNLSCTKPSPSL